MRAALVLLTARINYRATVVIPKRAAHSTHPNVTLSYGPVPVRLTGEWSGGFIIDSIWIHYPYWDVIFPDWLEAIFVIRLV